MKMVFDIIFYANAGLEYGSGRCII